MMSDCEWVVERCKALLNKNDKNAAKAWILTARSLFPDDFDVQYEAFSLHLCSGELNEAASVFVNLYSKFPSRPKLQHYVSDLVTEVVSGQLQEGVKTDLFNLLSNVTQRTLLREAADKATEVVDRCRILLVELRLFPDSATTIGLDMYDQLSQASSSTQLLIADNKHRDMLVNDVIPLLVNSPHIHTGQPITRSDGTSTTLKTSHLCQWLESAASYYTTVISEGALQNKTGRVGWEKLHSLLMMTADKCGWKEVFVTKMPGPHLAPLVRWMGLEKLSGYNTRMQSFEAPRSIAIACFYIAVFLFFETAWEYCSSLFSPGGGQPCWVMIEERLVRPAEDKSAAKRRKLDDSSETHLNFQSGSVTFDQRLVECFTVATNCWEFLQSNVTYRGEFSRLCQQWGAFEWSWLSSFRADMNMYKGEHEIAAQVLQHEWQKIPETERTKPESLRYLIQTVNCCALMGDIKGACTHACDVIRLLPDNTEPQKGSAPAVPPPAINRPPAFRQLRLLKCCCADTIPFCTEVIIKTLQDIAFSDPTQDLALGQLVVLLQYNWPREEERFASIITAIQKRKKFSIADYLPYIIVIDMLEELVFLSNCESLEITLVVQAEGSRTRTVTRGLNREAREELMAAVDRQVQRCHEPIEPVLREFFQKEKLCITSEK